MPPFAGSTREWVEKNGRSTALVPRSATKPQLKREGLHLPSFYKALGELFDEQRDAIDRHIEDRLDSIVGITKEIERQNLDRIERIASSLDQALDTYLHAPPSVRGFGTTQHPLQKTSYVQGLLAPISRGHLTPDWFKDLLGPN
jgi:hypothetical protein